MKHVLTIALGVMFLLGTGCRDKQNKNPAFMPVCFRNEVVKTQYYVPAMTNDTIASTIKYCMEYWLIGSIDGNDRVLPVESREYCTIDALQDSNTARAIAYNIQNPGFWIRADQREAYIATQLHRIGVVSCEYDLDERTVTIQYESSQLRKMNFEALIAHMGLAVNDRPSIPQ